MSLTRREFALRAAAAGAVLAGARGTARASTPFSAAGAIQAKPAAAPSDPYALVDPELLPAIKAFPTLTFDKELLVQARLVPAAPALPPPAPPITERYIPGPNGAPTLRIYVIDPSPGASGRPLFLHTHGGGYVMPNSNMGPFLQKIAMDCGCVVVSVDYRLAPETHFPGSFEDNYTALKWASANANMLGIDRTRIAVGGESAGGGHAAALAIHARDRGEVPIIFQLLIYPMLDDRTGSTRPVPPAIGTFVWNAASNRFGWSSLLGVPAGSPNVPTGSVPARVTNLAGLPPAFIGVGSIDLFVEEDLEYASRLVAAGVPTEVLVVPGAYHGFDLLVPDASVSRQFTSTWKLALRRAFAMGAS